jgi:hypothetical protein
MEGRDRVALGNGFRRIRSKPRIAARFAKVWRPCLFVAPNRNLLHLTIESFWGEPMISFGSLTILRIRRLEFRGQASRAPRDYRK